MNKLSLFWLAVFSLLVSGAAFAAKEGVVSAQNVKIYGAKGDGSHDDTANIQAAIDAAEAAGGGTVFLPGSATYLISAAGTKTDAQPDTYSYALAVPSNVTLNLGNSTLKLKANSNAAMITNKNPNLTTDSDITITGGILDGNQAAQRYDGGFNDDEHACIYMYGVTRLSVYNVHVKNAMQYAGRFLAVTKSNFDKLYSVGSRGSGWHFGNNGKELTDSRIGEIGSETAAGLTGNATGNSVILVAQRVQIGSVTSLNDTFGFKIQNTSSDVTVDNVVSYGCADNAIKIERGLAGDAGVPSRIIYGNAVVSHGLQSGFYMDAPNDVSIGQYVGNANGSDAGTPDFVMSGNRISAGSIVSTAPGLEGLYVAPETTSFSVGRVQITDPDKTQQFAQCAGTGTEGHIGFLDMRDTRSDTDGGDERALVGWNQNGTCNMTIDRVRADNIGNNGTAFYMQAGTARIGSSQLTNGGTSATALTQSGGTVYLENGQSPLWYVPGGTFHVIAGQSGTVVMDTQQATQTVSFVSNEPDDQYKVNLSIVGAGTTATGATRFFITGKAVNQFVLNAESASGDAGTVTVDWQLYR